jgi:UrcA family protein
MKKVETLQAALATIGFLMVSGPSLAQNSMQEVTVEAPHTVTTGPPGRATALSIVYRVSYADLNLATASGAAELQKRVQDSADKACAQLVKLYPESTAAETHCAQDAAKSGMAQANKAIAAAEKAAKK